MTIKIISILISNMVAINSFSVYVSIQFKPLQFFKQLISRNPLYRKVFVSQSFCFA